MLTALTAIVLAGSSTQVAKPIALFNGKTLDGWHMDVPDLDGDPTKGKPFFVRDGVLVSLGNPMGHLITDASYENYKLSLEWRWTNGPGNSGLIVHISKPRHIRNFLPQGIEAQLMSGNAGDFHLFGETLFKPGSKTDKAGKNFTDDSEKAVGEWNLMEVECRGDTIKVWVNRTLVNHGEGSSVTKGQIGLQSEGAEVEFRRLELTKL